jgi:hypothetical protein
MREQADFKAPYSVLAKAAELLLKCAGFLDDRDEAIRTDSRHCDTYYAIDTDVITLYLEPALRFTYLDVFGKSTSPSTIRPLTFLLGDFLFTSGKPLVPNHKQQCRFLLVPPHDEELLTMLSAIHRKLVKAQPRLESERFDALTKAFEKYERDTRDQDTRDRALSESLNAHVRDLVQLWHPFEGPRAALERFAQLPQTTFQRLDTYCEGNFTFPMWDPVNSVEDRKMADPMIERWEKLLNEHKRRESQPDYAVRCDAEVLATIEYVNSYLRDDRKKLVLVTGSDYLYDAAAFELPGEERRFDELYLRRPQAFLAHPEFFLRSDPKRLPFNLIGWFNLFFPSGLRRAFQRQAVVDRASLRSILEGKDRSIDQVIEFLVEAEEGAPRISRLIDEWEKQVDAVAKDRYADGLEKAGERGVRNLADQLKELYEKNWSVEALRSFVFKESLGSISKLYSTSVWVGLWSRAPRQEMRGVPALRLDVGRAAITLYLDKVTSLQSKRAVTREDLQELLELSKKLEEVDKSLYYTHVIHAWAFAAKGHYYATLTLATTAMAICDNLKKEERGYRLGREAAYLACIATRRSLHDRSGLKKAEELLEEAVKRRANPDAPEDVRFTSERLAIATRRIYFDFFCDGKLDTKNVTDIVTALDQVVGNAGDEKTDWIRQWVLRQALANYFTLVLILKGSGHSEDLPDPAEIQENLELHRKILADPQYGGKPEDDPYAHLISEISHANWALNEEAKKKAAEAARARCDAAKKARVDRRPYDINRLAFLEGCIPPRNNPR